MNDTAETKQCSNCKIDILSSNYMVHSIYCHRNFFMCSKCQERINHHQKTEHENTNHVVVQCKYCNLKLEKYCLMKHLENDCPHRVLNCQICGIEVKAADITEHEDYCGSRTEKCLECNQFVMLKYKTIHIDSDHVFIKLPDEPGPSPSWQNGRRTLFNFMPDLTKKSFAKTSNQRKKFSETRKRRPKISSVNIGSGRNSIHISSQENNTVCSNDPIEPYSEAKCDEKSNESIGSINKFKKKNFYSKTNEEDNIDNDLKLKADVLNIQKTEKQLQKEVHDWPALSDFNSLQISSEMQNDSKSNYRDSAANYEAEGGSDLAFALKASRELNTPSLNNKPAFGKGKGESYKMVEHICSRPRVKGLQENINASNSKKKVKVRSCDTDFADDFLLYASKQDTKCKIKEFKLPCQYCGASILSDDLILHQSRCYKFLNENINDVREKQNCMPYEDVEIPCEICNELFKLSVLKKHEVHCNRNLPNAQTRQKDQVKIVKNIKSVKSLPGIQNGLEVNSPRLSGVGTRFEWLTDLSTSARERETDSLKKLNEQKEVCSKTSKFSHNDRRTPSSTKM